MSLSLLAPLALGLGVLVALPVLAHLARQTPRERRAFGAMLLLQRVVKRLRRRRRVKDPWLLLIRMLAVAALVMAVSAPRLSYQGAVPEYGASGQVVLLLDRSLSMSLLQGGTTLLQQARERAIDVVQDLPEGVAVGLVAFDDDALRLTSSMTRDHARVVSQIQALQPTSGASDLRGALLEARRLLGGEPGEVLLFSDEAGPNMVAEATAEIAHLVEAGSAIIPQGTFADPPRNVAVTGAKYGDGLEGGAVTVRVANYGPDPIEVGCEVTLPDGASIPIFVDLPPAGEAEERITIPTEARGGVGQVRCDDPDLALDDARYFHLPRVGASRVLVVDGDPGDTPTRSEIYFLERALAPWGGVRSGVTLDVTTPVGLSNLDPDVHRVVFLANVADPRSFGPRLTEFVRRGGNLVVTGGDNVTADRYNAALGSILPAPLRKPRSVASPGEEGVPVALPDVEEPMFLPFRRGGRGSFSRIRSHTLLTFEPYRDGDELRTVLSYDNGLPALVERRIGQGRVMVWTGTVDLGWGNLPLQSVFMPLVQRLVSYLGGEAGSGAARFDGVVGQPVVIGLPDLTLEPSVVGPDGTEVRSRIDGAKLTFTPESAGAYRLELESAPPLAYVAVNTDPLESDVKRYDSVAEVERQLAPDLLMRHVDLSRPLLWLAFGLLVTSSLVAVRGGA
ncbi:MAG: VWA domain-containing protein [Myxococcales bacterium]|nr:VWA domain-containing protein [Myxococcales bacterium]